MNNLSVIITFHENPSYLHNCLCSLIPELPVSAEIVVILNNKDPDKINFSLDDFDSIRMIKIYENLGYAKAVNLGVKKAKYENLLILDSDIHLFPGWYKAISKTFEYHENAAISCKLLNPATDRVLDFGIAFTKFNCPHPFMDLEKDHVLVSSDRKVQAFCSAFLLVRKSLFSTIGGMNEDFGTLYTDLDFCLRLKDVEADCVISSNCMAYHYGSELGLEDRIYKNQLIKGDVKGRFFLENAERVTLDMDTYIQESFEHAKQAQNMTFCDSYLIVSTMNIVDYEWYTNKLIDFMGGGDLIRIHDGSRDARSIKLFETLGYDLLNYKGPLAYCVDRFICIQENYAWWEVRKERGDIVFDRNGNIMPVQEVI